MKSKKLSDMNAVPFVDLSYDMFMTVWFDFFYIYFGNMN